ncbi:MAG: HIT family protein [Immundisolibacteraceae bacterium]|nr:HIT family protein [Immundisolibacteraceae bacterium]
MKSACVFCDIVAGKSVATTVHEDHWTLAFLDINPINPGHTLVIPKQHHQNLLEIDQQAYQHLADATLKVAQAVQAAINPDGINIFQANGVAAGQTVFHLHNHVLPRYQHDRLRVELLTDHSDQAAELLSAVRQPAQIAATIRQQLK